jgi:hypothetical protein
MAGITTELRFTQNAELSVTCEFYLKYRVIKNDCRGFNNLSYTIHLREEYIVALMDQEILKVFFYDVRCAVVVYFSDRSAVY